MNGRKRVPLGADGYTVIAFGVWRNLSAMAGRVVAPAAYRDGIADTYRGLPTWWRWAGRTGCREGIRAL